jgi:hypothetical protein
MVSITPRLLYPGKGPRCPLRSSLGGPQSRFGWLIEEKNDFPLPEFEPQIDLSLALLLACVIPALREK